jgi:hypothetical protein
MHFSEHALVIKREREERRERERENDYGFGVQATKVC